MIAHLQTLAAAGASRPARGPAAGPSEGEVVGIALSDRLAAALNEALEKVAVHLRLVDARTASPRSLSGAQVILVGQGVAESHHDLVASIRQSAPAAAVLLVAEPGDDFATVLGLELGADAFVRADEGCRVLMSQVRAMMRQSARWRARAADGQALRIQVGRCLLEHEACSVHIGGECHALPLPQFALLWALAGKVGCVVDRGALADLLHSTSGRRYPRQVDGVVSRLRERLDSLRSGLRIRAVRGTGYLLSVQP